MLGHPLKGHTGSVWSVAFSPDGKQIVSGSRDSTVRIWDLKTGATLKHPLIGHTDSILSVASSSDGKRIASSSSERTAAIFTGKDSKPGLNSGHRSHLQDGWVIDSLGHHIVWVPAWLRDDFCLPWNSLVLGPAGTVKLDLTYFVHGPEWEKCINPMTVI
ncbi:WD40-repeat-containing domain protein, partial [Mycena galericulata]